MPQVPQSSTASQGAEKTENAVIPSAARDPSWFKCPQKEGFLVAFRNDSDFDFFRNYFSG